jgi:serine/threonine protein kinase
MPIAMSEVSNEIQPLSLGHKLADRYEITEDLGERHGGHYYQAKDSHENNHLCTISQIGRPRKEAEADKMKKNLERAHRVASWIRINGALIPKDFLYENECLYSVLPPAYPHSLKDFIAQKGPTVAVMVGWLQELAGVLEIFHDARQPQFLGQLPLENFRVDDDNHIQLVGFDLTPDYKLEYTSHDQEFAKAPEEKYEARSDVWALGTLLQKCVEVSKDDVKKVFRGESDLKNLLQTMTNVDPEKRVSNMATLKTRLERINWSKAPKLSNTGITDAPIHVYTVQEKSPFAEMMLKYRMYAMGGLAAFLLIVALLQFIFPSSME